MKSTFCKDLQELRKFATHFLTLSITRGVGLKENQLRKFPNSTIFSSIKVIPNYIYFQRKRTTQFMSGSSSILPGLRALPSTKRTGNVSLPKKNSYTALNTAIYSLVKIGFFRSKLYLQHLTYIFQTLTDCTWEATHKKFIFLVVEPLGSG